MRHRNKISAMPVVLVTGCGSGIGLALAGLLYNKKEYRVIVTSRAKHLPFLMERFTDSYRFKIEQLDITNEGNIYRLVNSICSEWGRIDVIVNNAAVCYRGVVEHMDTEAEDLQLKTNYLGPMSLIRAVLPIMREQRSGQIINLSSVSGTLGMPTMSSYSASKHALEGASEALWYEAQPFGIAVNLMELGFVNSQSFKNVVLARKAAMSSQLSGPLSEFYISMVPFIERLMNLTPSSAEQVAKKIMHTIEVKPKRLRIAATIDVVAFEFIKRILPSSLLSRLVLLCLPGTYRWGGKWRCQPSARQPVSELRITP